MPEMLYPGCNKNGRHSSAVLILAACTIVSEADAPNQAEIEPVSATNGEPVNLRFTLWSSNEAHLTMLNDIAADYQKMHPSYQSL